VGKDTLTRRFAIVADPRVKTTAAELQQQFDLAIKVRDRINDIVDAASRVESIQGQLDQRVSMTKDQSYAKRVSDVVKPAREKLETVRADLFEIGCHADQCTLDQPIKLYNIMLTIAGQVQTGDYAPTKQHADMFADFSSKVGDQQRRLQLIEDTDIAAVNKVLTELQVPLVFAPPKKAPIVP
jgi:hypothetical protein